MKLLVPALALSLLSGCARPEVPAPLLGKYLTKGALSRYDCIVELKQICAPFRDPDFILEKERMRIELGLSSVLDFRVVRVSPDRIDLELVEVVAVDVRRPASEPAALVREGAHLVYEGPHPHERIAAAFDREHRGYSRDAARITDRLVTWAEYEAFVQTLRRRWLPGGSCESLGAKTLRDEVFDFSAPRTYCLDTPDHEPPHRARFIPLP